MAGIWRIISHWRANGYRYLQNPYVVYVYQSSHARITNHYLHDPCFLDEYETVYSFCETQPNKVSVMFDLMMFDLRILQIKDPQFKDQKSSRYL